MEYVEGQTLRDVLNREAPLPPAGRWRSWSRCSPPWPLPTTLDWSTGT